jgi:hypothetical protein
MASWISLLLGLLKLVNWMLEQKQIHDAMTAGQDAEITRQLQEVMKKTEKGREIMEKVKLLTDTDLDDKLRKLEPP